jgi:hypothetical protein
MSEHIKKLAEQADMEWDTHVWCWLANPPHLEKFAELVRDNERDKLQSHYLVIVDQIRKDEREACARLCLKLTQAKASGDSYEDGAADCAAAIRAKSEPSPAFKNYMGDNWAGIV